jgi:hypothetical protein
MTQQTTTFGIEIEFKTQRSRHEIALALTEAGIFTVAESYNHSSRDHWKLVTDASVSGGMELVSPILVYGDEAFAQIETVSRVLVRMGARIDRQCGLHVHHGTAGMTDPQIAKVVALYAKFETAIDRMMPASRRGRANSFCSSLQIRRTWKETVAVLNACKTRQELMTLLPSRYVKVNVQSLLRHGTIEFRHHSGTVEGSKIVAWVKITRAMVERGAQTARVSIRDDKPDVARFRAIIGKELSGYFRSRTRQLAPAA